MTEQERRKIGDALFARATAPQRTSKQSSEILEGLRAGLASDHLSLDEGLKRGATVADPAKYMRAMDGHDEKPRKVGPIVRDINERIERAKQEINAEAALADPDSIFYYYQKLIRLRKTYPVIVYGAYTLLEKNDPNLCVYFRELAGEKLLVICNFSDKKQAYTLPEGFLGTQILITNLNRRAVDEPSLTLQPYEAVVKLSKE